MHPLVQKTKTAYKILKTQGVKSLLHNTYKKMGEAVAKTDVTALYDFVINQEEIPFSQADAQKHPIGEKVIVNWVIPAPAVGSGGHINIFRFINYLQRSGFQNRVYISVGQFPDDATLHHFLDKYFTLDSGVETYCDCSKIGFAHATFATSWQTAYFVRRFQNTLHKFYFVQDFEPFFFAKGTDYALAENTYRFGFTGITAGSWLSQKLSAEYGMKCYDFGFSYDQSLYFPTQESAAPSEEKTIFFYGRPFTPRRSFELGVMAFEALYKKYQNFRVIFAGEPLSQYKFSFPNSCMGVLPVEKLGEFYSTCDICLVLSSTNLSLLPLEIMGCKSLVMSNKGPQCQWLLNNDNCVLTELDPLEISEKLYEYLTNPQKAAQVKEKGYAFAKQTDWDKEGEKVKNAILQELGI